MSTYYKMGKSRHIRPISVVLILWLRLSGFRVLAMESTKFIMVDLQSRWTKGLIFKNQTITNSMSNKTPTKCSYRIYSLSRGCVIIKTKTYLIVHVVNPMLLQKYLRHVSRTLRSKRFTAKSCTKKTLRTVDSLRPTSTRTLFCDFHKHIYILHVMCCLTATFALYYTTNHIYIILNEEDITVAARLSSIVPNVYRDLTNIK